MCSIIFPPKESTILYIKVFPNEYLRSVFDASAIYDGTDLIYTTWQQHNVIVLRPAEIETSDIPTAPNITYLRFYSDKNEAEMAKEISLSIMGAVERGSLIFLAATWITGFVRNLLSELENSFSVTPCCYYPSTNKQPNKYEALLAADAITPELSVARWKSLDGVPRSRKLYRKHIYGVGGYECTHVQETTALEGCSNYYFEVALENIICSPSSHLIIGRSGALCGNVVIVNQILNGFVFLGFSTLFPDSFDLEEKYRLIENTRALASNLLTNSAISAPAIGFDFVVYREGEGVKTAIVDVNQRITSTIGIVILLAGALGADVIEDIATGDMHVTYLGRIYTTVQLAEFHRNYEIEDYMALGSTFTGSATVFNFPRARDADVMIGLLIVGGTARNHERLVQEVLETQRDIVALSPIYIVRT